MAALPIDSGAGRFLFVLIGIGVVIALVPALLELRDGAPLLAFLAPVITASIAGQIFRSVDSGGAASPVQVGVVALLAGISWLLFFRFRASGG